MMKFSKLSVAALALVVLSGTALAQMKPEDAIASRQAGYKFMAWNMGNIKRNVEGEYNKDQVVAAANVIAAIANSGMGKLYLPGTDKEQFGKLGQSCKGCHEKFKVDDKK